MGKAIIQRRTKNRHRAIRVDKNACVLFGRKPVVRFRERLMRLNLPQGTFLPMIIGEIRRYLRDNNSVRISRSVRDTAYKAMQVKERLTNEKSRDPTIEEIATELGIPRVDVVIALESVIEPVSLYEPVYSDGGDTIYVMDQVGDHNDDKSWLDEISLKESIRNLGDREKRILHLRFFCGMTQVEVSQEIGISQAQVSRLEKGALTRIKSND